MKHWGGTCGPFFSVGFAMFRIFVMLAMVGVIGFLTPRIAWGQNAGVGPIKVEDESRPWFSPGRLDYTRPATFGFFGYGASKKTTAIPPADHTVGLPPMVSPTVPQTSDSELFLPKTRKTFDPLGEGAVVSPGLYATSISATAIPQTRAVSPADAAGYLEGGDEAEILRTSSHFTSIRPDDRLSGFLLMPRTTRDSFFQGAAAEMGYIPNVGTRQSGMTWVGGSATFGLPVPDTNHPLLLTPLIEWRNVTLPDASQEFFGKKPSLYSVGGIIRYLIPVGDVTLLDFSTGLRWNSDFVASDSRALRITVTGNAVWKLTDETRLVLGATYTGLPGWRVIPIGGLLWRPTDDLSIEAIFPRPKIAKRLSCLGPEVGGGPDSLYWLYLAGECDYDRSVFRTQPTDGSISETNATLTYRDLRFFGGLERQAPNDINWAIEAGLVFSRTLELESLSTPGMYEKIHPDTSVLARLKVMY